MIWCGWLLRGTPGGVIAGLGFLLPSCLLLLALSWGYMRFSALPQVGAALQGLAAVVIALIAQALLRLLPRLLNERWLVLLAAVAVVALAVLRWPFVAVLAVALAAGLARSAGQRGEERVLGRLHVLAGTRLRRSAGWLLGGMAAWLLLLAAFVLFAGSVDGRVAAVYRAVTQISLLAFGGAYPALAQASELFVDQLGWLTAREAASGLALAETTPGPLVIVLQFHGYIAAWHAPAPFTPPVAAALGALAASSAIFAPSFLLMLCLAPFVATLRRDPRIFAAMAGVTAVTLAAIADLGLRFAAVTLFVAGRPQWPAIALALAAFVLLRRGVEMHWVVLAGLVAGALAFN